MNKLKRAIAISIIICLLSSLAVAFAADSGNADAADYYVTAEVEYDEEIYNTLIALNILDTEFLSGDKFMSRGEFVKYALKLMGVNAEEIKVETNPYIDVKAGEGYGDYVLTAQALGLVKVPADRMFMPNTPISYDEALIVMVRLAGYESKATEDGVGGYYKVAASLGFAKHIPAETNGYISRANIMTMIYNMLNMNVAVIVGTNGHFNQYSENPANNVLSVYHEIYTYDGLVSKNPYTTLVTPQSGTARGYIVVGDTTFKVGNTVYYDLIGHYAKVYYTEEDDEFVIIYAHKFKTDSLVIEDKDIQGIDRNTFKYADNGKVKRVKLAEGYKVLYNYMAYPDFTEKDIHIKQGKATLVKNSNDDQYSVIIIEDYTDYIVNGTNAVDEIIYVKYPERTSISITNDGKKTVLAYDATGKQINPEAIPADSVISVFQSKCEGYTVIHMCEKVAPGTLVEIALDDRLVEIDYIPTEVSVSFLEDLKKMTVGYEGDFYYSSFGKVVGVKDKNSSEIRYGYMMAMGREQRLDAPVEMKILEQTGAINIYHLRNKIKLDGTQTESDDVLAYSQLLQTYDGETYTNPQIIKYSVNQYNEISYIDTLTLGSTEDPEYTLSKLSVQDVTYRGDTKMFEHSVILGTTASIFTIPVVKSGNPADITKIEDDDYQVGLNEFLNNEKYDIEAYDVSDGGVSDVIIHQVEYDLGGEIGGNYRSISTSNHSAVVEKVVTALYNGEETKKVYLFSNGITTAYYANRENTVRKPVYDENGQETGQYKFLQPGDIIRFKTNFKGEMDGVVVDFDIDRTDPGRFTVDDGEDVGKAYGMVYSQGDGGVRMSCVTPDNGLTFDFSPENLHVFAVGRASLTIIDFVNLKPNGSPTIRTASPSEIIDYKNMPEQASMLYIHSKWYDIMESYIIKR